MNRNHQCVFAKHIGNPKEYIFSVPDRLIVFEGDALFVDTKRGKQFAIATTDIFESPNIDEIAKRYGAYLPLRSVLAVCPKELKEKIERTAKDKTITNIQSAIKQQSLQDKIVRLVLDYIDSKEEALPF